MRFLQLQPGHQPVEGFPHGEAGAGQVKHRVALVPEVVVDPHEAGEDGLALSLVPQGLVPLDVGLLFGGADGEVADVPGRDAALAEGVLHHVGLHGVDAELVQCQALALHLTKGVHQAVRVLGDILIGPDHGVALDDAAAHRHTGEQDGGALRLALVDDLQGTGGGFTGIKNGFRLR